MTEIKHCISYIKIIVVIQGFMLLSSYAKFYAEIFISLYSQANDPFN